MVSLIVFYGLFVLTVGSAAITAFSRNIVYSAFALFGSFAGVAGIYILLAADFVSMVQIFIYIGGILVLTIFAVMLTQGIAEVNGIEPRGRARCRRLNSNGAGGMVMYYRDRADAMVPADGPCR